MKTSEAVELIREAVGDVRGIWADLGAGSGTFTRALAELAGGSAEIYAVDRDPAALDDLRRWALRTSARVTAIEADIAESFDLPVTQLLDGILVANALHFFPDPGAVLGRLVQLLRIGGRVVLVEYDRRAASQWVPYPIPVSQLPELSARAGLSSLVVTASRSSDYGGILYAAAADRVMADRSRSRHA